MSSLFFYSWLFSLVHINAIEFTDDLFVIQFVFLGERFLAYLVSFSVMKGAEGDSSSIVSFDAFTAFALWVFMVCLRIR